jgi:hypothetical protein
MALFRSVTVGLLGACLYFIVQLAQPDEPVAPPPVTTVSAVAVAPITVIDVAHGVTPAMISSLVRVGPDERIAAVDDQRVSSDLAAGAVLAERLRGAGRYVDLTIERGPMERRVLVLLH